MRVEAIGGGVFVTLTLLNHFVRGEGWGMSLLASLISTTVFLVILRRAI